MVIDVEVFFSPRNLFLTSNILPMFTFADRKVRRLSRASVEGEFAVQKIWPAQQCDRNLASRTESEIQDKEVDDKSMVHVLLISKHFLYLAKRNENFQSYEPQHYTFLFRDTFLKLLLHTKIIKFHRKTIHPWTFSVTHNLKEGRLNTL